MESNVLALPNPYLAAARELYGEKVESAHDYHLPDLRCVVAVHGLGLRRWMQRIPNGEWEKIRKPNFLPLYRSELIERNPEANIWIVPDEPTADRLKSDPAFTWLATVWPDKATDLGLLKGHHLVVWSGVLAGERNLKGRFVPSAQMMAICKINQDLKIICADDLPGRWMDANPDHGITDLLFLPKITSQDFEEKEKSKKEAQPCDDIEKPYEPQIVRTPDGVQCAKIGWTTYYLKPAGLWAEEWRENGTTTTYLGAPLHILAETRNTRGGENGRLIEWRDSDGRKHKAAIPIELTHGDGLELIRTLASEGWRVRNGGRVSRLVCEYLNMWPVKARAICTESLGWTGSAYVTPDRIVGEKPEEKIVYQSSSGISVGFSKKGSLDGWKSEVARYARGNSRLLLAISAALAGPLLRPLDKYGGGLHFHSDSTTGKTTALRVAASVWGDHKSSTMIRRWRATENALEGIACASNDGILLLDELRQADPRAVGQIAYMLANGQGKDRMTKTISVRKTLTWNLIFLSTGEHTLQQMMAETNQKTVTGQALRIPSIPCELGPMGIIEELHGFESSRALMQKGIEPGVNRHYGHAGQAWLDRIVPDIEEVKKQAQKLCERFERECSQKSNQVLRVAERFAIVAAAGELATEYGLTGWHLGDAWDACRRCFDDWHAFEGPGSEAKSNDILSHIRGILEREALRFPPVDMPPNEMPKGGPILGYRRYNGLGGMEFLVTSGTFDREFCGNMRQNVVKTILKERGWLLKGDAGRDKKNVMTPFGRQWCYVLTNKALEGEL